MQTQQHDEVGSGLDSTTARKLPEHLRRWCHRAPFASVSPHARIACAVSLWVFMSTTIASAQPCSSYWYPAEGAPPVTVERVYAMTLWDPDGDGPREKVIVMGGNINPGGVVAYDPQQHSWMTFGAGVPGGAYGLAVLPSGELVAARAGGGGGVFKWNGTSWLPLANTELNNAAAVKVSPAGELYATGMIRGGIAFLAGVARWNGTTWERVGPTISQSISDFVFRSDGSLIATGQITPSTNSTPVKFAKWDGQTWSDLGGPTNSGLTYKLALSPGDGVVAFGGPITYQSTSAVALLWDGVTWSRVGDDEMWGYARAAAHRPDGSIILAGGSFTSPTRPTLNLIARWDGQAWNSLQFGGSYTQALLMLPNGDLAVGGRTQPAQVNEAAGPLWFFRFSDQPDHVLQPPFASATLGLGVDNEIALPATGAGPFTFKWQRQTISSGVVRWPQIISATIPFDGPGGFAYVRVAVNDFATHTNLTVSSSLTARYYASNCRRLTVRGVVTGACGEAVSPLITLNFCPSDFNADRHTDVIDLVDYLGVWFDQFGTTVATTVPAQTNANFDASTLVTASDLFAFLDQWSAPDAACVR